jgi:hypothetical protein
VAPFEGNPWKPDARLIADVSVFIVLRMLVYLLVRNEPLVTILFGVVVAVRLAVIPPDRSGWLLIALVTVMGVAYEALLIAFGLYIYYDPVFLGMPGWLLIYWVFMIPVFMKGIFDRIESTLAMRETAGPDGKPTG